jgi:hypothetical protein
MRSWCIHEGYEASVILGGVPLQPIELPTGSRIVVCETTPGFSTYEINKFRHKVESSEMIIVYPQDNFFKGSLIPEIAKKISSELDADMTFINIFKFKRKIYRQIDNPDKNAPHIELRQYTTSETYQYNKEGELMGRSLFGNSAPWPEKYNYHEKNFIDIDKAKYKDNLSQNPDVYVANIINSDDEIVLYDASIELSKWLRRNL